LPLRRARPTPPRPSSPAPVSSPPSSSLSKRMLISSIPL
jgi:hypothetical protein